MGDSDTDKREKQARIAKKVREEILSTEETYVSQLNQLIEIYISPLRKMFSDARNTKKTPPLDTKEMSTMFGNIETIFQVNTHFLQELRRNQECETNNKPGKGIGAIFLEFAPYFKMYTDYVGNHDRATDLLSKIQSTGGRKYNSFKSFLSQSQKKAPLTALLILPIQRVPRYRLLLQELVKRTDDSVPDYPQLNQALELIKKSATHINDAVKRMDRSRKVRAVQGRFAAGTQFVSPSRQFIKEGHCAKLSDGNRYRQKYQFFLFNDLFLYADFSKLTKKYKVHWQSDINASFALKDHSDRDDSRYKFQFEILTPGKRFMMVFKDEAVKIGWRDAITKCIEDRKSALNYIVKEPSRSDIGSIDVKPPRPPRPSEENVRLLFELHASLEKAKQLIEQRRNDPPSKAALVLFDYQAADEGELSFAAGDTVEVISMDSEHGQEWWQGEINGSSGIFPSNYVRLFSRCWFRATADYQADSETELSLINGEIIKVTKMLTEGWWYAKSVTSRKFGWIPANYVEECEENYLEPQNTISATRLSSRSKSVGGLSREQTPRGVESKKRRERDGGGPGGHATFSAKTISILTNFFKIRPQKTDLVKRGIWKDEAPKIRASMPITKTFVSNVDIKSVPKSQTTLAGPRTNSGISHAKRGSASGSASESGLSNPDATEVRSPPLPDGPPPTAETPSPLSSSVASLRSPNIAHVRALSTPPNMIRVPTTTGPNPQKIPNPMKKPSVPPPIPTTGVPSATTPKPNNPTVLPPPIPGMEKAVKGRESKKIAPLGPGPPPMRIGSKTRVSNGATRKPAAVGGIFKGKRPPPPPNQTVKTRARSQTMRLRATPPPTRSASASVSGGRGALTRGPGGSPSVLARQKMLFGGLKPADLKSNLRMVSKKLPVNNSHRRSNTTIPGGPTRKPPPPITKKGKSPPPPPGPGKGRRPPPPPTR
ncbi:hypothetical protein AAMO2058_000022500 [Amorphochlora amoebiformis]|uniref:Uncharacterized protein n=1 Tax=Amorphochlora amoebiformis TaxID=1561963 RepID=A0A7S0DC90_9EUKA|mmetsp:Transcript_23639/g.37195  ORF Transcript_23639/g.37195 Transcript_23639/m.37195 type:complete len:941 (+) Transcript_23639:120-2942(+)